MPRSFTFATITEYQAAKGNNGAIYAELVSSGIKSGSCVSKITATGDMFIDSINPFVTPELGQEGDTLYYSSTEGYRFLRAGNTTWDADSYGQVYIDLAKIPSGFSVVAPYTDIFNFKQTDENIGSGKASMTKILGNSLAWNQLFDWYSTSDVRTNAYSLSLSGKVFTLEAQLTGAKYTFLSFNQYKSAGHVYYISFDVQPITGTPKDVWAKASESMSGSFVQPYSSAGRYSFVDSFKGTGSNLIFGVSYDNTGSYSVELGYINYIDLTLLYGPAIDGLTDAQILAKFESEFPGYHSYNEGTLLSNKAKAIEFVGFNKWDGSGQEGKAVSAINGGIETWAPGIATDYIRVLPNTEYYNNLTVIGSASWGLAYYDANKAYISGMASNSGAWSTTFTTPVNCYYIRATTKIADKSIAIINLSGPRNGQYEPYKKVVLPLPNLDQIKVYSHNIWDEEWEAGSINDSGTKTESSTRFRSKNYIPVFPSTVYYGHYGTSGATLFAWFYDADKNFIDTSGIVNINNKTFTTPSNATYMLICPYNGGTTYANDICINLSSSFNGQYEPHGILTMEGGLKSAGSVMDEIVRNKYIKRVGSVDLGTLTYYYESSRFRTVIEARKALSKNMLCVCYVTEKLDIAIADMTDKTVKSAGGTGTSIYFRDDSYSDAATFKTAMSGVMLYYELTTPIEYEIYSPTKMPFNWKYRVSEYHTKKMLPENGENPTSAPFACEIKQI